MDTQSKSLGISKILFYQIIFTGLVTLAWSLESMQAVTAALFGALVAVTNSWLLAWRAGRIQQRPANDPQGDLRAMYFAFVERFAIVIMLFVAGFGALHLAALPLLTSFIAGQAVQTVLSLKTGLTSNGR